METWDEFQALAEEQSIRIPEHWRTLELLDQNPEMPYWDNQSTPETETAQEIVARSFQLMYAEIEPQLESNEFDWGAFKPLNINHLARLPQFSRQELRAGGHGEALNAIRTTSGPSWRMVVELGPEVKAYGIYPGGQDGTPGSLYYDQMIDTWLEGGYYELNFLSGPEEAGEEIWLRQHFEPGTHTH